jgi:hypothetical protein
MDIKQKVFCGQKARNDVRKFSGTQLERGWKQSLQTVGQKWT